MKSLWQTAQHVQNLIGGLARPALIEAVERTGMTGKPLGMLLHAYDYQPDSLTAEKIQCCVPYYSTASFQPLIDSLVSDGFLYQADDGYRLTAKGSDAAETIVLAMYHALAKSESPQALEKIAGYLRRVLDAAKNNPATPETPCMSNKTMPDLALSDSYLGWIGEYLGQLYVYRCDCHVAAWRPTGASGDIWEPFTFLWRGEANSLETLIERVGKERMSRGHQPEDYAAFIDDLIRRGWVASDNGVLSVTEAGETLRDEAERRTDDLFYGVWRCLSDEELNDLNTLLNDLKITLEQQHETSL